MRSAAEACSVSQRYASSQDQCRSATPGSVAEVEPQDVGCSLDVRPALSACSSWRHTAVLFRVSMYRRSDVRSVRAAGSAVAAALTDLDQIVVALVTEYTSPLEKQEQPGD